MKISNFKRYSLTTKTLTAFFIVLLILIAIRTLLIQPKIKEKNLNDEINFINSQINLIEDLYSENKKVDLNQLIDSLKLNSSYKSLKIITTHSRQKTNDPDLLQWIITINKSSPSPIYLLYTLDKIEIYKLKKNSIFFLLPETLIAVFISFLICIFILKKSLINIDSLTKKLKKSLDEKEILLKEIHHRVKNNLAMTIGLIELQENEISHLHTKKVLIDIKERIYTMELLHRKLYESENMDNISFKSYIEDLTQMISSAYDKKRIVQVNYTIEDINLDIETVMSYGIILNELITNCFKYAYNTNQKPIFEIKSVKEDNKLLLYVKDNGKGLNKDFNSISQQSLGLRLISSIVKFKLMGEFSYEYKNGSKFKIITKI